MRRINRSKKRYYAGLLKSNNTLIVSIVKQDIAEHLGICVKTISRHLDKSSMYNTDVYTIWRDIRPLSMYTGFAIKQPSRGRN